MPSNDKETVLFICTHNSARSQMAEGLLRALHGNRYEALSAGTEPSSVNPFAVRAMFEIGIDITGHRSKSVDVYAGRAIDHVVTVCDSARESCPYSPARKRNLHQSFEDPSAAEGTDEEKMEAFRRVRDEIRVWIQETFGRERVGRPGGYPFADRHAVSRCVKECVTVWQGQ